LFIFRAVSLAVDGLTPCGLHGTANVISCDVTPKQEDGSAVFCIRNGLLFCSRTELPLTKVTIDS